VDLVDVTQEFLDKAKTYLGEEGQRVGRYLCSGLQDLVPESGRYDVIWIQWVIGESAPGSSRTAKARRMFFWELFLIRCEVEGQGCGTRSDCKAL